MAHTYEIMVPHIQPHEEVLGLNCSRVFNPSLSFTTMGSPQHLWTVGAMRDAFMWNGAPPFFRGTAYPPPPEDDFWMKHVGFIPPAGLQLWSYERIYDTHRITDVAPYFCQGQTRCGRKVTCHMVELKHCTGPLSMCAGCVKAQARRGNLVRPDPATVLASWYFCDRTHAAG